MIRTRDFLLYMIALVFLVSSIGYTVIGDMGAVNTEMREPIAFGANEATVFSASVSAANELDRASYIKRMQAKLANGEGKIPGAPVTLTSSVSVDEEEIPDDEAFVFEDESFTQRNVQWCNVLEQTEDIEMTWNSSDVEIYTADGMRLITHTNTETDNLVASLVLPMLHSRAAYDTCLPHNIVGVSVDGSLIKNDDALRFHMFDEHTLIGYALDGFPIYGVSTEDKSLDACGGFDTDAGYRYHVRANENFILGCFASPPAQFIRN